MAKVFRKKDNVECRVIEKECFLLDPKEARVIRLNEVAGLIWECISRGLDTGEILKEVCASFDVKPEAAEKDLNNFLDILLKEELIKWVGQKSPVLLK